MQVGQTAPECRGFSARRLRAVGADRIRDQRALWGGDVYRINELVRVTKEPTHASSSRPWRTLGRGGKTKDNQYDRGERVHCGSMSSVGWSDAASGGQLTEGKCRFGYAIGPTSPTLTAPRHFSQRTAKFTRRMVRSSLGGEVICLCGGTFSGHLRAWLGEWRGRRIARASFLIRRQKRWSPKCL